MVNIMVESALKKIQEEGSDLTFFVEKRRSMARKRIEVSRTPHTDSRVLGYGHHIGPGAVAISNREKKLEKRLS
jgi:hypothetical protein